MARKQVTLSPKHQALADRIGFDPAVLAAFIDRQWTELRQLTIDRWDAKGRPIDEPVAGLCVNDSRLRIDYLVGDLRTRFEPQGYLFFLSDTGDEETPATLAAIRGEDQYDILRLMRTEDANGNRSNTSVIAALKRWEKQCPFRIVGAGRDWVEGRFRKNPPDMVAFARKVIRLAPDSYGQGPYGDVEDFAEAMRRARSFYLWWD
jgi:hypothetical protein